MSHLHQLPCNIYSKTTMVSNASIGNDAPLPIVKATLTPWQNIRMWPAICKRRLKEYVAFESLAARCLAGVVLYCIARVLGVLGFAKREFTLLCALHRADALGIASARAEALIQQANSGVRADLRLIFCQHIDNYTPAPNTKRFFDAPEKLLGSGILVLKSSGELEKGVLCVNYSYMFPLIAKCFDIEAIARKYHILLEPDWSGYCDPNILSYCRYSFPAFVQAYEPRDAAVIANANSNLRLVPTSTNWWIDHRLFTPLSNVPKDIDLVMVAGWGTYKRHYRFFSALSKLRKRGHRPSVLLLGYPLDLTQDEIVRQAEYYGVADQLEVHESVPVEGMNDMLNRAKVNVLWSRKEGVNRAIIEGMFAGIPCLVREGFNYGYRYPYINSQTGCFSSERELPEKLLWMIKHHDEFNPREWVLNNMTCQHAAKLVSDAIGKAAAERGEPWSGGVVAKLSQLHGMGYWNPADSSLFADDYTYLRTLLRN